MACTIEISSQVVLVISITMRGAEDIACMLFMPYLKYVHDVTLVTQKLKA